MAPSKDRKRKFHRRSKYGCQTCKKRHVRCDEHKPLWYVQITHSRSIWDPNSLDLDEAYLAVTPRFYPMLKLIGGSTYCLQSGSDCIYPFPEQVVPSNAPLDAGCTSDDAGMGHLPLARTVPNFNSSLNDYVGGVFDDLPEASKRLLRHCMCLQNEARYCITSKANVSLTKVSQYAVWGQKPVIREVESSA